MAVGRFLISRDATGAFRWVLRDAEGLTVAESTEGFSEHKGCMASLERLRKTIAKAEVMDLTMPATVIKPKGTRKPVAVAASRGKAGGATRNGVAKSNLTSKRGAAKKKGKR